MLKFDLSRSAIVAGIGLVAVSVLDVLFDGGAPASGTRSSPVSALRC
jgi:hypothetical protein